MADPADRQDPPPLATPPASPALNATPPTGDPPSPPAPPEKPDWREARIAELSGKLKAEREARVAEKAEFETKLAAPKPDPANPPPPAPVGPTEAEIAERVRREATRLNSVQEFNKACDGAVAAGRAQFSDFDTQLAAVQSMVIRGDQESEQRYWSLIGSALKTGNAPAIIHKIGQDKGEVARLMALDPESRAIELTKMTLDPSNTEISSAPKPLTPVGSRGAPHTAIDPTDKDRADGLTTAEWMRRREAQVNPQGAREMSLVGLLIAIIVLGIIFYLVWWLIQMLPLPAPFKQIALVVLILIAILVLLDQVGFLGNLGTYRIH